MAMPYGYFNSHNGAWKGGRRMICYRPLWETMARKKATTYTLREKYRISHATVQRLQKNVPVSTYTLNRLCEILDCRLDEVAEYIPDGSK